MVPAVPIDFDDESIHPKVIVVHFMAKRVSIHFYTELYDIK